MTPISSTSRNDPIWRAWRCPKCQYDRAGLPAASACPECGQQPAAETLVLGAHVRAHRRSIYFSLANAVFIGGLGITYLLRGNQGQGLWRAVIALSMLAVFGYAIFRRRQLKAERASGFALAIDASGVEIWTGGRMRKRLPIRHLVDARVGSDDKPHMIVIKRFLKSRFVIEYPPPPIAAIIDEIRRRRRW